MKRGKICGEYSRKGFCMKGGYRHLELSKWFNFLIQFYFSDNPGGSSECGQIIILFNQTIKPEYSKSTVLVGLFVVFGRICILQSYHKWQLNDI